jgi:hypothetical protein
MEMEMMSAKSKIVFSEFCPTCGRHPWAPFRSYLDNKIVDGCVDSFHSGHLVSPSQSSAWHLRREAAQIRAAQKKARDGYVTEYRREVLS